MGRPRSENPYERQQLSEEAIAIRQRGVATQMTFVVQPWIQEEAALLHGSMDCPVQMS